MSGPLMNTYPPSPVTFVRGEGARLWDTEGRSYLDFVGGVAVCSLGHAHPAVAEAVAEQARTLLHVSNLYGTTVGNEVAATLDRLIGGGEAGQGRVFFGNSGAEANECAIKLARKWAGAPAGPRSSQAGDVSSRAGPGSSQAGGGGSQAGGRNSQAGGGAGRRYVVISAERSFHGRTLATLHATGQFHRHPPFQPLPAGFRHVPYGSLDALAAAITAPDVAALLLETIQGEGGVWPAPPGYLEGARELCDQAGVLLMIDEVQTGLGRTGRWFGFQHHGIQPDVVTVAKALGNGMPIGACWARADVADAFVPGDHATTLGGQPLAASAARAVLAVMEAEDAAGRAARAGERLAAGLGKLAGVVEVRGRGLILGLELTPDRPAGDVAAAALAAGLLVNPVQPTTLRLLPSLLVTADEVDEAVAILAEVLAEGPA